MATKRLEITREEWNEIRKESRRQVKDLCIEHLERCGIPKSDYKMRLHNKMTAGFIEIDMVNPLTSGQLIKSELRRLLSNICYTSYKGEIVERFKLDLFVNDICGRPIR